jgi:DNA-directed RNA polymerase specialized sigma24 family protein
VEELASNLSGSFASTQGVIRALVTYTDWWQPATGSLLQVGGARRDGGYGDGLRSGLLDTLDERTELTRRMTRLSERERAVLFLWYVRQLAAFEIGRELGISRRQCFRIRSKAIRSLVDDETDAA